MKPGIYGDISNEDYHRGPGLSSSDLRSIWRSPEHFRTEKETPREETPQMKLGSATHCAVFEPERFEKEYIAAQGDIDKRTKAGKERWAELEASGKIVLTAEENRKVCGITKSIRQHPIAGALTSDGMAEQSVYWRSSVGGVLCKARPDYLRRAGDTWTIIDLKTTEDARPKAFERSACSFGYHIQAAFYFDGCTEILDRPVGAFSFVVVEREPPYALMVYIAGQDFLNLGRDIILHLLKQYQRCESENIWPSYSEEIQELGVPAWAY